MVADWKDGRQTGADLRTKIFEELFFRKIEVSLQNNG
jgi:hypothetical protein